MIYALGYATKAGLDILVRKDIGPDEIIHVPAVEIGNMHWPDPEVMNDIITNMGSSDIFLSPSGPNNDYLPGAFRNSASVHWVNPAVLTDRHGRGQELKPEQLLDLWVRDTSSESQGIFYPYMPDDLQIAQLGLQYAAWLRVEAEKVAVGNSMDHSLRREREAFRNKLVDREEWVRSRARDARLRFASWGKTGGITVSKEDLDLFEENRRSEFYAIFDTCLNGTTKQVEKAMKRLKEIEMSTIIALLEDHQKRIKRFLKDLPHLAIFEGLKGIGPKSAAGVLVHIGNPLRFPTFPQLNSYNGLSVLGGQAIQRHRAEQPEDLRFSHRGRQVLCFDFGEKAHQHSGIFQDLYYAYKLHQYLIYWGLIEMTQEIFRYWHGKTPTDSQVRVWVSRLATIAPDLPIFNRSPKQQAMLKGVVSEPTWSGLKLLFSREKEGGNVQMPPSRIERQCSRMNGRLLLQLTYYRWLEMLGRPLPLTRDFIYQNQCQSVGAPPDKYDPEVILRFYQQSAKNLQEQGRTLPEEAWTTKDKDGNPKPRFPERLRVQ